MIGPDSALRIVRKSINFYRWLWDEKWVGLLNDLVDHHQNRHGDSHIKVATWQKTTNPAYKKTGFVHDISRSPEVPAFLLNYVYIEIA
jgi:hypothetical protein